MTDEILLLTLLYTHPKDQQKTKSRAVTPTLQAPTILDLDKLQHSSVVEAITNHIPLASRAAVGPVLSKKLVTFFSRLQYTECTQFLSKLKL